MCIATPDHWHAIITLAALRAGKGVYCQKPITSGQVGGRSAICCHLMNQSYYNHAKHLWDPAAFAFTGGTGDPKWLTREYRAPWTV